MFIGSYPGTMDDKGRTTIPAKMRNTLGERIILVKGLDECLYIFTEPEWQIYYENHIANRETSDVKARKLERFFSSSAMECGIDRQGRINIPDDYLKHSSIEKDVFFASCGNHIEVWDKAKFDEEMSSISAEISDLMHDAEKTPTKDSDGV